MALRAAPRLRGASISEFWAALGAPLIGVGATKAGRAWLCGRWCEAPRAAGGVSNLNNTAHYKNPSTTRRCLSGQGPCILASIFRGAFILVSFLALNFGLGILLRGPLFRRPPAKSSTTLAIGAWPVLTSRSSRTVAFGASLAGAARSLEPSNRLRSTSRTSVSRHLR